MNKVGQKLKFLVKGRWMDRQGIRAWEEFFRRNRRSGLISIENVGLILVWRGIPFRGIIYQGEPDRISRVWVVELADDVVREAILRGEFSPDALRVGDEIFILPDFGAESADSVIVSILIPQNSRLRRSVEKWLEDAFDNVSIIDTVHERTGLIIMTSWMEKEYGLPEGNLPIIILSEIPVPVEGERVFLMTKPFTRNQFMRLLTEAGLLN